MVDKESLGITGTPFRMDIERGKIREFAVATYSSNRNYVEDEFPVVPPTFLTTTLLWQTEGSDPWRKVELDGKRGLHAEQKYEFFGPPPRAGTRLNCTSRDRRHLHEAGTEGRRDDFCRDDNGFRRRTGKSHCSGNYDRSGNRSTDCGGILINTVSVPTPWVVGPVSRTDFVRYQGASGDMNPIHHDQVFAEAAGYPSPFSVGMFQAGLLATFATDWLGAENIRAIRVRFLEQVWPDDTLTCSALVERTYADDEGDKIDVELACTRQTGGLAVKAWATFVRPPLVPSERP